MSNTCIITGKRTSTGNNVSHSKRRTKRKFKVNLQKKNLINPATGQPVSVKVSAKGLKILKKWISDGKKPDLAAMKKAVK